MARVEWSRLDGGEVETLLANLYYNRDGRFLRIRPAQGDLGVDLILPAADPRLWDVYQIKKFALNLEAGQKAQIEASFRRVLVALVRYELPLNDWYVVMPLDPTPGNVTWFDGMPEAAYAALEADTDLALTADELRRIRDWLDAPGRTIAWRGLNACESLVADYPYVVDYYLHGGQQRIRDAVAEVAKLLQRDLSVQANESAALAGGEQPTAALLTPGEIRDHLLRLDRVLDTDPHFRYGHSLDVNRPDLLPEPGLVAATQERISGGRWLTFKVYVRSAQSLLERPIPVTLTFDFEPSAEDLQAIELWQRFGKPLQVPATIKADMPGGLSRGEKAGTVHLSPAADTLKQARIRLRIADPAGTPLAECAFRTDSATGAGGMWVRGTDDAGLLGLEMLIASDGVTTADFRLEALAGREATAVLSPVRFAGFLAAPNTLQFAAAYGPFTDMTQLTMDEPLLPEAVIRFVENLDTIQTVTATPVVIPDVSAMSTEQRLAIGRAASLISGHTLVAHWRPFKVGDTGTAEFDPAGHYEFLVIERLVVSLGSTQHVLGAQKAKPLSARIEQLADGSARLTPDQNDIAHFDFLHEIPEGVTDRQTVYSRRIDDPAEDL